ncbi:MULTISPECIES: hypothetical protein [Pseudomonas syringae group]|uniref:hypothetical protein n=1 Tax=Pseudomonas syringae group TaxID=136849 RepID=UPI000F7BA448|nr:MULTISPECIES: hypothetical protein [Pseudomonas syringae group]MCK9715223.1 hypothetical protein [Pseudomonas syringae pv. syringae]MCK9761305.1 hypothetical protein [Pseudomonas syringae pv. syringae]
MAALNPLNTIMNRLRKTNTSNQPLNPDLLPPDDDEPAENGMKSEIDVDNEYGTLSGHRITSGIKKNGSEKYDKPTEEAKIKFDAILKEYCEKYQLTSHYNPLYGNYLLKDAQGKGVYNVKEHGEFRHNGYDILGDHYEDMVRISARQFLKNNLKVCPFVEENDPKIPAAMQEANLRLTIEIMLGEGVEFERLKINSKTWRHILDDYKPKEENKNELPENEVSGIAHATPQANAPPAVEADKTVNQPKSEDKPTTVDEIYPDTKVVSWLDSMAIETVLNKDKPAEPVTHDDVVSTKKPEFKEEEEKARLEKELRWALDTAAGNVGLLLKQNDSFAARNYQVEFSADGESVTIQNAQPAADNTIHKVTLQTAEIPDGKLYKEEAIAFYADKLGKPAPATNAADFDALFDPKVHSTEKKVEEAAEPEPEAKKKTKLKI